MNGDAKRALPETTAVVAMGARAIEARLLQELKARLAAPPVPGSPMAPLWVVVATGALRRHVAARIAERLGPVACGVKVLTLWSAAREVLKRSGWRAPAGAALFEVFARRAARAEIDLAELGQWDDGFGAAVASISDLLSAGLNAVAPRQALQALDGPAPEERRARALVRAAARTARDLEAAGVGRIADLLAAAARCLRQEGPAALEARAVLVHGFADATGRAIEFLCALATVAPMCVHLDAPPDPASPEQRDRGATLVERFAQLLDLTAAAAPALIPRPALDCFTAVGADAETREVAERVRAAQAAGVRWESIGVVARDLAPYAVAIRRHFSVLGVPFSGGAAPVGLTPAERRRRAALAVLAEGRRVAADLWLDAADERRLLGAAEAVSVFDLRIALRALGVARLSDVAALDVGRALQGRGVLRLPVRRGLARPAPAEGAEEEDRDAEPGPVQAPRRTIPAAALEAAVSAAQRLTAFLDAWPPTTSLAAHAARFRRGLGEELGFHETTAERPDWFEIGAAAAALDRADLELTREEFVLMLGQAVDGAAGGRLGGQGGGVQVLGVAQARGITFERLFLIGLNREIFPRASAPDPLLTDDARRRLRMTWPALGVKSEAPTEERHLFAQLLASAERITLSWQRADEQGRERNRSAFVEELLLRGALPAPLDVPRLRAAQLAWAPPAAPRRLRTARESLQLAALTGTRTSFAELLPLALREAADRFPARLALREPPTAAVAAARRRILDEQDPDWSEEEGWRRAQEPGPYLGFVGPATLPLDPRADRIFVTTLESFARCPWRTLLQKLLRVEPAPDPAAEFAEFDPQLIGVTVHRALAELTAGGPGRSGARLADLCGQRPALIERPLEAAVSAAVGRAAAATAQEESLALPGLVHALALLARPYVIRALDSDWPAPGAAVPVLGAEVEGVATVDPPAGRRRELAFRADRVDRQETHFVLTDYKTSGPLSTAVTPAVRARHLEAAVEDGSRLQAAAYAAADLGRPTVGRYLSLRPVGDPELATLEASSSDPAVTAAFPAAVAALLEAWDAGVFTPRVENLEGAQPRICATCEVAAACLRDDSGARRRLHLVARHALERGAAAGGPPLAALALLWPRGQGVGARRSSRGAAEGER